MKCLGWPVEEILFIATAPVLVPTAKSKWPPIFLKRLSATSKRKGESSPRVFLFCSWATYWAIQTYGSVLYSGKCVFWCAIVILSPPFQVSAAVSAEHSIVRQQPPQRSRPQPRYIAYLLPLQLEAVIERLGRARSDCSWGNINRCILGVVAHFLFLFFSFLFRFQLIFSLSPLHPFSRSMSLSISWPWIRSIICLFFSRIYRRFALLAVFTFRFFFFCVPQNQRNPPSNVYSGPPPPTSVTSHNSFRCCRLRAHHVFFHVFGRLPVAMKFIGRE